MKIKRFTAKDLPTATAMIKEEFGLAAMILSQRKLSPQEGSGVEITAGVRDEDLPATLKNTPESKAFQSKTQTAPRLGLNAYQQASRAGVDFAEVSRNDLNKLELSLSQEIGELKELILGLAHRQNLAEKWRDRPELVKTYRNLVSSGLSANDSRSLVELAAENVSAWGGPVFENLRRVIEAKLKVVDMSSKPPKRLALVGPSGVGKTTALVNLAAFYRQRGLTPAAITLDTLRLGAAEQLTEYARILGMGVRVCQNHDEFQEAVEIFESSSDLLLIDTPGRSFHREEGRQELASYFKMARAETILVLSATMKENDLLAAYDRANIFQQKALICSKLDETESLGSLAGFILSAMPSLAFFSLSPKTSEDFMMATENKFLDLWLKNDF